MENVQSKTDRLDGNKDDRQTECKLGYLLKKYTKIVKEHQSKIPFIPVSEDLDLKPLLGDTLRIVCKDGTKMTFKFTMYSKTLNLLKGIQMPEWISKEVDQGSIEKIKVLYR